MGSWDWVPFTGSISNFCSGGVGVGIRQRIVFTPMGEGKRTDISAITGAMKTSFSMNTNRPPRNTMLLLKFASLRKPEFRGQTTLSAILTLTVLSIFVLYLYLYLYYLINYINIYINCMQDQIQ